MARRRHVLIGLAALVLFALPLAASDEAITGRWLIDFDEDGSLQLTLKHGARGHGSWNSSDDYAVKDFRGLQRPSAREEVPARFELVRDAGTIAFEGHLSSSGGSGRFSFSPNAEYVQALRSMGHRVSDGETLFSLAVHDVSRSFIRELESLGYKGLSLDDLVSMRIHGAGPEFVRRLKALGYSRLSADDLVSMRIHGASPEFIRDLESLGYTRLSADDLVSMRIHGVTPEYVRDLQSLGYRNVSADDLVSMRIHGVSIEFVKKMQARYSNVSVDDLVSMKIHGRS
jgi:hypothetical protein